MPSFGKVRWLLPIPHSPALVGYSYEITSGPGNPPNITIPFVENNEYEMWFSILVSDPTGELQNQELVITDLEELVAISYTLQLSPNPTEDILNIQLNSHQAMEVELDLVDMNGRIIKKIFNGFAIQGSASYQLRITDISPGMYMVVGKSQEGVLVKKFIKI